MDELDSSTTDRGRVGRALPPSGAFTSDVVSPFITTAVIGYLHTIPAGQRWVDMIMSYLRLEAIPIAKGVSPNLPVRFPPIVMRSHQSPMRLPSAKSRPNEVSMWMKARLFDPKHIPFISDPGLYAREWTEWWTLCQPAWRQGKGWPLPKDNQTATNWCKFAYRGQNGLFLVVMSTTWWASSIQSAKDWAGFDEAVEDIQWVLDQVISSLEAIPAPTPNTNRATSREPMPIPGATWMTREGGKRQPKPSRRLLEAAGI